MGHAEHLVANGDPPASDISAFVIDPNTGALTPVPGSPLAAAEGSEALAEYVLTPETGSTPPLSLPR
jgi:hypothetical protein